MSRVRWQDTITNEEVKRRCGVENLEHGLRKIRLRWVGHVKRRDENSILRKVMKLGVEGRRPVGRPKKTWCKVVDEDRKQWRDSYHVRPQEWETRDVKQR